MTLASEFGHFDIVQELLDRGAANSRTTDLKTPLHFASANEHITIVQLLIHRLVDADERSQSLSTVDVQVQDDNGWTPLHTAARNGHLGIVKLLPESGVDVNVRNRSDQISLDLASASGNREVTRYLAEYMGVMDLWDGIDAIPLDEGTQSAAFDTTAPSLSSIEDADTRRSLETTSLHCIARQRKATLGLSSHYSTGVQMLMNRMSSTRPPYTQLRWIGNPRS